MKNQLKIWTILFVTVTILMVGCKKEQAPLDALDQFAIEQNDERSQINAIPHCNSDEKMAELLADPTYYKEHQEKFTRLAIELNNIEDRAVCTNPKIIPVAIHYDGVNGNADCLRQLAQRQMDVLNKDIQGRNSDITKWTNNAASRFSGVSNGEACLRFCLADKNHPEGFGLSNGTPAITINQVNGNNLFDSRWSGYLNIFVVSGIPYLGSSPLGGRGNGDGVDISATAFGVGNGCGSVVPTAPYDLGRTVTHEVGHYLLLDHIWGDGCGVDDRVADTPEQRRDYSGCPPLSSTSCGSVDMHMNYMDYVDDACMYMFSAGQVARMEAYVNSSLNNLTNNASNKCSSAGNGGGDGDGDGGGNVCSQVSQLDITNIRRRKATVEWSAVPNARRYKIRHRERGTSSWTTTNVNAQELSKQLNNLKPNTVYEYRFKVKCNSNSTSWTARKTFRTKS